MNEFEYNWLPCMQMMNMPSQFYPMVTMPEQQLESMYPNIYNIIFPVIVSHCDTMDMTQGPMYIPTREQLEAAADGILSRVEGDVEKAVMQDAREKDRQLGFGGRRVARNLIEILLIRELIRRRRRPFFGVPFFGGFGPGFGGGFGPGFGGIF